MMRHKIALEFTMPDDFKDGDAATGLIQEAIDDVFGGDAWARAPWQASNGVVITQLFRLSDRSEEQC